MTRRRPALADDVELVRFAYRRGPHAVLGRSSTGTYLRLTPEEADIVERLDGTVTVGELAAATADDDGIGPSDVVELVECLSTEGLFEERPVDVDAALERALHPSTTRSRFATAIRTATVQWRHADPLARTLYRAGTRFWFTRIGVVVAGLIGIAGVAAVIAVVSDDGIEIRAQQVGLELAAILVLDLVLVSIHELGHATALVHYGRRVNGAGIHLYFGSPAFFIEASDGLLLDKRKRIVQALAGPYFEAVATAAAAIALWMFPDGAVGQVLYRFVLINIFALWLNLVPLLELDGYWVLSDTLEYPDLRPRSLTFVRREFWQRLRRRDRLSRGEWFLAAYGIGGITFTIFAVGSAVFFWERLFGDAVAELVALGPGGVAVLVVAGLLIGGPVLRLLVQAGRAGRSWLRHRWRRMRFRREKPWRVEAARAIAALPLFEDIPRQDLNDLAGRVDLRRCGHGEALVRAGDRADAFYVVRSGTFEVVDEDPDTGHDVVLRRLGPGDAFGELALLSTGYRTATVRAAATGEVFVVDRSTFERLLSARTASIPSYAPAAADLLAIRALGPFARLDVGELLVAATHGHWRTIPAGEAAVTQGEPADAFYAIESGRLAATVDGTAVRELGAGDHFGELGLLGEGTRTATVRALTPARVFELDTIGFGEVLEHRFRQRRLTTTRCLELVMDH